MKDFITIFKKGFNFLLVPVEQGVFVKFKSSIEARKFIVSHVHGTYKISNLIRFSDSAVVFRYFIIDTSAGGSVLNPGFASTYNECMTLIDRYLIRRETV